MPGHLDGISCLLSFTINPTDPFSGSSKDWAQLERDIRDGLKVRGHKVQDVNVFHMHATAVTMGKRVTAIERAVAAKARARAKRP